MIGLLLILACPGSRAEAQTFFIDGNAFAGIERRTHVEISEERDESPSLNGTVAGGGLTIGSWLNPRVSVRFEMSYPGTVTFSDERIDAVGVLPTLTITQRVEGSERLRSAAALLAYHTGRKHRVQLAYIGGAAFLVATQRQKVTRTQTTSTPTTSTVQFETSLESHANLYNVTVETGLDADIALVGRFSVVPQLRVIGFGGGVSIRPGVALRAAW